MYAHGGEEDDPSRFHTTVTFTERGTQTVVTMRSLFLSAAMRDQVIEQYGAIEGGRQHLSRLGAYVRTL